MSLSNQPALVPPAPPNPVRGSFKRQIVLYGAIALTLVTLAAGVLWVTTGQAQSRSSFDVKLVSLLKAGEQTDRALFTELQQIQTEHVSNLPADQGPADKAVKELKVAVDKIGLGNLQLTDSGKDKAADQQIKALFSDPAKRLDQARQQLQTGTVAGTENPASLPEMRQAIADFAAKAPDLMKDSVVAPSAKRYAEAVANNPPWPVGQDEPEKFDRKDSLATLETTANEAESKATTAPVVYMWLTIGLAVLALATWLAFVLGRNSWAKVAPKAPKPAKIKAPKPAKEPKPTKVKAPQPDVTANSADPSSQSAKEAPSTAPKPTTPAAPVATGTKLAPSGPASTGLASSRTAAPSASFGLTDSPARPLASPTLGGGSKPTGVPGAGVPATGTPSGGQPRRIPFAPTAGPGRPGAAASATGPGTAGAPPAARPEPTTPQVPPAKPGASAPTAGPAKPVPVTPAPGEPTTPSSQAEPAKKAGPRIPWRTTGGDK